MLNPKKLVNLAQFMISRVIIGINLQINKFEFFSSLFMHQSIPSTNIPPGGPRGFALYCCPGAGIYTWWPSPGGGFLHIHKITFSTVKSILSLNWHLDHTSMRFRGSSDFNIKTIRTFGLKAYTCTSKRRSIYIVKVIEGITPFRLSP